MAWLLAAGVTIGARTLGRLPGAAGYVYKRVRRCLRTQRPEGRFRAAQRLLAYVRRQAHAGRVQLWYTDECRFSRLAPLTHAWQQRGQRAQSVPAVRGKGGYSMLGFWCEPSAAAAAAAAGAGAAAAAAAGAAAAAAAAAASFHYWTSDTAFTADLWVKAVAEWLALQPGPTVLVLDNASIHRAHPVRACLTMWRERGLTLFYLPPYSPELNRIELLWHHFKHCWLAAADYATEQTLFRRINDIASEINAKYRITSG